MIAGQMVKANRTVDALVRPEVAGEGDRLLRMFEQRGWVASGRGRYRVSVPLYCARRVATRACREELTEFSRTVLPLVIDEIRLREPHRTDPRRIARGKPVALNWVNRLWLALRGSEQWEVAVPRSGANTPGARLLEEEECARVQFASSYLAGPAPRGGMGIVLEMEPVRVHTEDMGPARTARVLAVVVGILLGGLAAALVAGNPGMPWGLRLVGWAVGLAIVCGMAWWVTGSHQGRRQRWLGLIPAVGVFVLLQWSLAGAWAKGPMTFPEILAATVWALGLLIGGFFVVRGWTHLLVLHAGAKALWSFGAFSFLFTASAAIGVFLVWMVMTSLGVHRGDVQETAVASAFIAFLFGTVVVGVVLVCGAIGGWAAYVRLFPARGSAADLIKVALGAAAVLVGFLFVLSLGVRLATDARDQLARGEGLIFDIGVAERVCAIDLTTPDGQKVGGASQEVSVTRGDDGQMRWWNTDGARGGAFVAVTPGGDARTSLPTTGSGCGP